MTVVYLSGEYLPLDRATISVEDRGFLFADGVYEVVRFYGGRPFELEAHLDRFEHSAKGAQLPLSSDALRLSGIINRLLEENSLQDTNFYVQYTRGAAHPRTHTFPEESRPTLLVMPVPIHSFQSEVYVRGVSALTMPDQRWRRCDIKSTMLLPNVIAKQHVRDLGAYEAILLRDGVVTEGTSTNIFAVLNDSLVTHRADQDILGGITRKVVLELAANLRLEIEERAFGVEELHGADEVFLTSTTSEVLPITRVDDREIGAGHPGPVALGLLDAYHRKAAS